MAAVAFRHARLDGLINTPLHLRRVARGLGSRESTVRVLGTDFVRHAPVGCELLYVLGHSEESGFITVEGGNVGASELAAWICRRGPPPATLWLNTCEAFRHGFVAAAIRVGVQQVVAPRAVVPTGLAVEAAQRLARAFAAHGEWPRALSDPTVPPELRIYDCRRATDGAAVELHPGVAGV